MDIIELGTLYNTTVNQNNDVLIGIDGTEGDLINPDLIGGNITIEDGESVIIDQNNGDNSTDTENTQNNITFVDTYNSGGEPVTYNFDVAETGTYQVELSNLQADLDLHIEDSAGNIVYSSSTEGNESEFISGELEPGDYVAHITADGDVTTDYSITISQLATDDNISVDDGEPILAEGDIVYRFFETEAQTQFYTTSEEERDSIIANLPQYEYQGESFIGAPNPEEVEDITGIVPIYRFFNTNTGVHIYTSSESEQAYITENLPHYNPEGISYYGYETQQEDSVPLYRFYNPSLDAHFYTPSQEERNEFLDSGNYQIEGEADGVAYYVNVAVSIDI